MKYPEKVKRQLDRIPDVRYPGRMSNDFRPDGMSDVTCRTGGPSACPREREPRGTF